MRKKIAKLTVGALMAGLLLTGCGSSTGTSDSSDIVSSVAGSSEELKNDNIVFAKVTKVSGKDITCEILERDESTKPEGSAKPDGEAPAQPEGSAKPDGEAPAQPEGSAKPEGEAPAQPEGSAKPDGNAPAQGGHGDGMRGFQSTGETKTVTVDDSIKICYVEQQGGTSEASLSDISEGTMIQLQYSDEKKLVEISIPKFTDRSDKQKASKDMESKTNSSTSGDSTDANTASSN